MNDFTLLVVEDQRAEIERIERHFFASYPGCKVAKASDPVAATNQFRKYLPEVVILDLGLSGYGPLAGLELISQFARIDASTRIIVLTGQTGDDVGLQAIKRGAASFLNKPINMLALQTLVIDFVQTAKFRRLAKENFSNDSLSGLVGKSEPMQNIYRLIRQCAKSDSNVFVVGETGTGKELVAHAVHNLSVRKDGPYSIYFGSVPGTLAEAELFGYVRGAFTGANSRGADGCIKRADGGTLFIDELCSLELSIQRKLLRVIEERKFKPLGSDDYVSSDFRLISAAQPRIYEFARSQQFREDLLSRVEVVTINLPPLRERKEDIPLLAEHFLRKANEELRESSAGHEVQSFSNACHRLLQTFDWPRNVRQLAHVVHHGVLQAQLRRSEQIDEIDIRQRLDAGMEREGVNVQPSLLGKTFREAIEICEQQLISDSLKRHNNSISDVCQELGLGRTTLWRKIKQYELLAANDPAASNS